MKKLLFIACLALVCSLQAQQYGRVIIYSKTNMLFNASLNSVGVTSQPASRLVFDFLDDYAYNAKIWISGLQAPVTLSLGSAPGYESVYSLSQDQYGSYILNLETKSVYVPVPATPPVTTMPVIPTAPLTPVQTTTSMYPVATDADFQQMLSSLKKEGFDDTRLNMAKSFLATNSISTDQVCSILKTFSFETTKVSFAKYAYSRTVDKQNYYKVNDVFSFSTSKKEISDYIRKQPN